MRIKDGNNVKGPPPPKYKAPVKKAPAVKKSNAIVDKAKQVKPAIAQAITKEAIRIAQQGGTQQWMKNNWDKSEIGRRTAAIKAGANKTAKDAVDLVNLNFPGFKTFNDLQKRPKRK